MCGIAGYVALDPRRTLDARPIDAMLQRIAHRGPDDEGIHQTTGAVLGFRRLSIIDVEGGHQPLFGQNSETAIICNGEIYNYRELADELSRKGHQFRTASDAEVAAHAFDEWGLDFLDHLDGMYALAIWDASRRRLILARDRLGEKPLYWTLKDGQLIFGSELTAVLAHPAVSAEIDPISLSAYLALEYVPAPNSMLRDIHKLEPGTALILEDGECRLDRYWTLSPHPGENLRYEDAVEELTGLLDDAVRSRLVSDVPLGVFLSGGIDSSTIAALAAHAGALETFSIGFEEKSFDESDFALTVARHIGSNHHQRIVSADEMPDWVPRLASLLDEPLGDASILPTAVLSEFARERVTVALGGDGGDELFAGYPMHQGQRVAGMFRALPGFVHRAAGFAVGGLPVSHRNFSFRFKVESYLRGAREAPPRNHALWMSSFSPAEQPHVMSKDLWRDSQQGKHAFDAIDQAWAGSDGAPLLARACHLDAKTYLPNDILTKVDRASMAIALEVRAPMLARSVVEFAFSLPDSFRMRGLKGKRILRDATRSLLPRQVIGRPKKGFGMPVAAWLRGALRPLVHDVLSSEAIASAGLFDPKGVARLLVEHEAGIRDHRKPIWTLLVFELWRRALFDENHQIR